VRSVLRVEVERLGLELQEGGGRLISQAAMQGVDARVVAYPVTQDILFAVAKVGPRSAVCMRLTRWMNSPTAGHAVACSVLECCFWCL
jgi:hypothetical protein